MFGCVDYLSISSDFEVTIIARLSAEGRQLLVICTRGDSEGIGCCPRVINLLSHLFNFFRRLG